jgi:formylglycine-generating enzyme required for sulfatase activity
MFLRLPAACAGGPKSRGCPRLPGEVVGVGLTVDEAIAKAAARMDARLPGGTEVALISVSSPSPVFSQYVLDGLESALVESGKLVVVDRSNLDKVREEQGFQMTADVSDDSAKSIGKMVGAGAIVTGRLTNIGSLYRLTLKSIDVQKAVVAVSFPADILKDERVQALLAQSGGGEGPQTIAKGSSTAAPAARGTPAAAPAPGGTSAGTSPAGGSSAGTSPAGLNATAQSAPVPTPAPAAPPPAANVPPGFVLVEGGTFLMGDSDIAKPVHTVKVKSFYMGKYEVTQKEWQEIMETDPSYFKGEKLPVEQVNWYEAIEYCNRRSQKEGLKPCYRGGGTSISCDWSANGYRLPTEAEWEYAAKGGNKDVMTSLYSGGSNEDLVAWYDGNSGRKTHNVGMKRANSLGIYDMSGNVYEWCWDWSGNYMSDKESDGIQTDPRGPNTGAYRVRRGGGWYNTGGRDLRSANRGGHNPSSGSYFLGFRLVRSSSPQ